MEIKPQLCQVQDALSILGGKWKPMILLFLMLEGTMRYRDLKQALPGITPKMLTSQLRELEQEELISRKVYPQVPPKVEYSITAYGMTLRPILDAMHAWSVEHMARKAARVAQG
ncbi:helix-turn-helix transcriptional regulator [Alicyclobacillus cycloheptanicus]|uniref:DNA-binding HxlR family transcriptional regulator n=1 Tax=Alicyclobacillus cycloheptanicus TaxID=1457 RepID=A0ABT9XHL0_9BACL|nr:helix-turn-helix domain-containing protein [Alicyclobacillus cycloheptanicus]MDQ0189803.1 DNA-binding HxlR family transcriptional regulator [Alicyclobacillus cycloheptanicus]WDM02506.1 helix-turn-helix transcriptional regulator [Alicyclobacillus cycloheptanicus]